jgi:tryptophan synthase beta chain
MSTTTNPVVLLPPEKMPKQWINLVPYIGYDLPLISPQTLEPGTPEEAMMIFSKDCVLQEVSQEPAIDIPDELREMYYYANRPTPLVRALRLEKAIGIDADTDGIKIYYKNESVSPAGSHKTNTALAQAYYARKNGIECLATETGAGQWGSALSYACALFGLKCRVYMVRASYKQKPYRGILMRTYGAEVWPSPSDQTDVGNTFLEQDPDHPGSLGIAISEAVEDCIKHNDNTRYSLGSVVNHVVLHQTIIGQEAKAQMEMLGEYPDIIIACHGGGSNFSGLTFPFLIDKIEDRKPDLRIIAAEPTAAPKLTKGVYTFDYGDTGHFAPIVKMYTIGSSFVPSPIHAGGLRYHGASPLVSMALNKGLIEADMLKQTEVIEAGVTFARTEGFPPAPESCHAVLEAIKQAKAAKENRENKIILFNLSGHGYFDLGAYQAYLDGNLEDFELPTAQIKESLKSLPQVSFG